MKGGNKGLFRSRFYYANYETFSKNPNCAYIGIQHTNGRQCHFPSSTLFRCTY